MHCVVLSCVVLVVLCRIELYCTVWHIVRANLRVPQFLKIERYAQRLSQRFCMGDGGSGWWAPDIIQLFRQRLMSHKSVKSCMTMPIGIMGIRVCFWLIEVHSSNWKKLLPIITCDIVALAFPHFTTFLETAVYLQVGVQYILYRPL